MITRKEPLENIGAAAKQPEMNTINRIKVFLFKGEIWADIISAAGIYILLRQQVHVEDVFLI